MLKASRGVKPNPGATSRKSVQRSRPVKVTSAAVTGDLRVPVRRARASSCPRSPQRGARGAPRPGSERRARSTNPEPGRESGPPGRTGAGKREAARAEGRHAPQSHKAFTVIPPDPKKRREIQKQAAAELAALEELRLSRAMAYVSISPSSVGGCLSLEEVRLKQQQEMMQAKRKQKPVMKHTPVLRS